MVDRQLRLFGDGPNPEDVGHAVPADLGQASHEAVGEEHELRLDEEQLRKAQGSFYTPPDVVRELVALTLGPILAERVQGGVAQVSSLRVIDPACGTGNFLVEAGNRIAGALEGLGLSPVDARRVAFTQCVAGVDIDAESVRLCRAVLAREAGLDHVPGAVLDRIICRNSLLYPLEDADVSADRRGDGRASWESYRSSIGAPDGFDLVVGNPPFLAQLRAETKFGADEVSLLSDRFGDLVHRYVDPAVLFLYLSLELVSDEGTVCMIQPVSSLAVADAGRTRKALVERAGFEFVWVANERVFDAAVDVCAVALGPSVQSARCVLFVGRDFASQLDVGAPDSGDDTWSSFLARAAGVPEVELVTGGVLADLVDATADFRDQYYGLVGHVVDRDAPDVLGFPPLITSGLIDPLRSLWGERRTKFNKEWFDSPCVEIAALEPAMRAWAQSRLVPKVLVATQTRVIECVVDGTGSVLPSVPVLTVTARDATVESLWMAAAVLLAPPVVALCLERHLGAALGADAIKLSAKQLLAIPTPADHEHWSAAASILSAAGEADVAHAINAAAVEMCLAYRVSDYEMLLRWWAARVKGGRNAT